jgi:hypothetical protein
MKRLLERSGKGRFSHKWAQYADANPLRAGLAMLGIGLVGVGVTIIPGG